MNFSKRPEFVMFPVTLKLCDGMQCAGQSSQDMVMNRRESIIILEIHLHRAFGAPFWKQLHV